MRQLTDPKRLQKATNCTGPMEWFTEQDFEVEREDVGKVRDHYLGYQHKSYKIQSSDVGRQLRDTSQGNGYRCWSFLTGPF